MYTRPRRLPSSKGSKGKYENGNASSTHRGQCFAKRAPLSCPHSSSCSDPNPCPSSTVASVHHQGPTERSHWRIACRESHGHDETVHAAGLCTGWPRTDCQGISHGDDRRPASCPFERPHKPPCLRRPDSKSHRTRHRSGLPNRHDRGLITPCEQNTSKRLAPSAPSVGIETKSESSRYKSLRSRLRRRIRLWRACCNAPTQTAKANFQSSTASLSFYHVCERTWPITSSTFTLEMI